MTKILVAIVCLHVLLLLILNFFPYPELFVYPYLTSQGLLPYKHIFDQHFPGLMFFPINLFTLGFDTPQMMRLLQIGLVIINQILIYKVSSKFITKSKLILLPNFLYLLWQPFFEGWVLWIDSFMPPFLLLSFYFLLQSELKKTKQIFISGFILGTALVFKQVLLPIILLVSIYLFFKTRKFKIFFLFGIGSVIPFLLMLLYINYIGVWNEFYYWTVTFNLTTFAEFGRKFATLSDLVKMLPVYGVAIGVSLYFIYKKYENVLLTLFFVSSLVFAYARFDFVHLQSSLPFVVLIIALGYQKFINNRKVFIGICYLLISLILIARFYSQNIGNKVYFWEEPEIQLANIVMQYSDPGDTVFALGTMPHLYSLTTTLPPGGVFVFHFPWFMMEAQAKILEGLMTDQPKIIVKDSNSISDGKNLVAYMKNIDEYVKNNFKLMQTYNGVEIWLKK